MSTFYYQMVKTPARLTRRQIWLNTERKIETILRKLEAPTRWYWDESKQALCVIVDEERVARNLRLAGRIAARTWLTNPQGKTMYAHYHAELNARLLETEKMLALHREHVPHSPRGAERQRKAFNAGFFWELEADRKSAAKNGGESWLNIF
jgi:hypothetical protein